MKLLAVCLSVFFLAGCGLLTAPKRYFSGQNFGDKGATPCPTRQLVDGRVPWCDYPNDGDGYDNY